MEYSLIIHIKMKQNKNQYCAMLKKTVLSILVIYNEFSLFTVLLF